MQAKLSCSLKPIICRRFTLRIASTSSISRSNPQSLLQSLALPVTIIIWRRWCPFFTPLPPPLLPLLVKLLLLDHIELSAKGAPPVKSPHHLTSCPLSISHHLAPLLLSTPALMVDLEALIIHQQQQQQQMANTFHRANHFCPHHH